ncbi:bifunctional hydroxymethylpyrimidine kinase/phosphomethylpyrimidine kinase [Acidocella sp.]|uniref:bifunctional hydroxymethylpyrimidine kinase/phosphomethylpyrimidine kinase n=1 Tax=Acidocella sp. TaxID=50710 RepID=UPI0026369602|nr:bifunctional hydroxymethylpyrimidine kinase/phosphomethylpyrimidine kinase [Acidocella sp.]
MKIVFTIAGSDSGGGAGIEADIKTISALGAYACTTITAVTAQNTLGVAGVHTLPAAFVALAMKTVLDDFRVDTVKLGMLANEAIIRAVAGVLPENIPIVLDPVMVATSGAVLLEEGAIAAMRQLLLPRATLVTPNLPEAARLTGLPVGNAAERIAAGHALRAMGARAALVKGGHGDDDMLTDYLVTDTAVEAIILPRLHTSSTHGTGCTMASAIATGLAQGLPLLASVRRARDYLQEAIRTAPGFGAGHGPVNHLVRI